MADENKKKLGDYLILEKIAHGGMAQIYKAQTTDPKGTGRLVVIKRILPHISSNKDYISMLVDEAKMASRFSHGNIAQIYDLGRVDDDYFIVMEYVDGKTLGEIFKAFQSRPEAIPIDILVYILMQVCQGLEYMHSRRDPQGKSLGIVHRDISPQNVIVSHSSDVKIIDFGVAKAFDRESYTESGVLKGKFAYMSPEQVDGSDLDNRSDIFSAGIILWEMLTGKRLFKQRTNQMTIKAIRKAKVPKLRNIRSDIPKDLEKIILQALHKNRKKRYASAAEMGYDLSRILVEHFPNFRPIQVSQFLMQYFGPEPDEADLSPELPELKVERKELPPPLVEKQIFSEDEEKTEIDRVPRQWPPFFRKPLFWKVAGGLFVAVYLSFVIKAFFALSQGALVFNITPKDSLVLVDGTQKRTKNGRLIVGVKSGKPVEVIITHQGYDPFSNTFTLEKNEEKKIEVALKVTIPPFGDLFVQSLPAGATVYLDNMEWNQKTPVKIPHLNKDKKFKIGVFLEGYAYEEREIGILPGDVFTLDIALRQNQGELEITSTPAGASVTLDGQVLGPTPYTFKNLKPDETLSFELTLEGYLKETSTVQVKGGQKTELHFELKKGTS